ncbi:uncharacterized protein SPSK_10353 [Sporothrix schenckii 1099-18]|uniref:Uncharacterized protein n=1 Tax=Sporothrix schenckii 1099-18 TaxID=1397361 RepID=A0A0F2M0X7_SPOSC|nr:uncharacterized protein SPSK_10353 [Sporothrix schenckii 1099-18]KJR81806.1 hypothetical protein SPSK_10353 [Sporothrix schenckii 1099-18]
MASGTSPARPTMTEHTSTARRTYDILGERSSTPYIVVPDDPSARIDTAPLFTACKNVVPFAVVAVLCRRSPLLVPLVSHLSPFVVFARDKFHWIRFPSLLIFDTKLLYWVASIAPVASTDHLY